jgi:hypothetical protein
MAQVAIDVPTRSRLESERNAGVTVPRTAIAGNGITAPGGKMVGCGILNNGCRVRFVGDDPLAAAAPRAEVT